MGALEREGGLEVVIEAVRGTKRRLSVTGLAGSSIGSKGELGPVRIIVALGAGLPILAEGKGGNALPGEKEAGVGDRAPELVVAGEAGHGPVGAAQLVAERAVGGDIHGGGAEAAMVVTAQAAVRLGARPPRREAAPVRIHVAGDTGRAAHVQQDTRPPDELGTGQGRQSAPLRSVTGGAGDLGVPAFEGEAQLGVLHRREEARAPGFDPVTGLAGPPMLAVLELTGVVVAVAVAAEGVRPAKENSRRTENRAAHPRGILRVAGAAGHLTVTPLQRIGGVAVLLDAVGRGPKALDAVAGLAVGLSALQGGLSRVHVAVTAVTALEGRPLAPGAHGIVTAGTLNPRVRAPEGIASPGMVEGSLVDLAEPLHRVAGGTGRAETALVRIPMAGATVLVRKRSVERKGLPPVVAGELEVRSLMALLAADLGVLPAEREARLRVIESDGGLPASLPMAPEAVLAQGAPVAVLVTEEACRLQADPVGLPVGPPPELQGGRDPELGLVAGAAPSLGVLPSKRPAASSVVESLGTTLLPLDELEVTASVVGMAGGTVPSTLPAVQPAIPRHEPGDLPVAAQARLVHRVPPMAFQAALDSVHLAVRRGEVAGRDLCPYGGAADDQ